MFDSHAHLNDEQFAMDLPDVLRRADEVGMEGIINIGFDLASSQRAVALAEEHAKLYAVVGVHPHDAVTLDADVRRQLETMAAHPKVVALGETGLDYYYDHSPRETQLAVFREHFQLARTLGKPLVIHSRDAAADTMAVIQDNADVACVLHCYSGSLEMAEQYLTLGHVISFAGPITFKNASRVRKVAAGVPLERTLIETDCPYLAPVPYRGKRNEPSYVLKVAEQLAELHNVPLDEVIRQTTANTKTFFGIQ